MVNIKHRKEECELKKKGLVLFIMISLVFGILVLSGCQSSNQTEPNNNEKPGINNKPNTNTMEIVLYFSDDQAEFLIPEKRNITIEENANDEVLAKSIVNELIAGPNDKNLSATIPSGTKLLALSIADGIATVDFSNEIRSNHPGGSAGETITLGSIVNTLTELQSIKSVQILIAGKKVDTLAGHWDISEPLERNEDIIKQQ